MRQRQLTEFKQDSDRMVLGESHGADEVERKQSMEMPTERQWTDSLRLLLQRVEAEMLRSDFSVRGYLRRVLQLEAFLQWLEDDAPGPLSLTLSAAERELV